MDILSILIETTKFEERRTFQFCTELVHLRNKSNNDNGPLSQQRPAHIVLSGTQFAVLAFLCGRDSDERVFTIFVQQNSENATLRITYLVSCVLMSCLDVFKVFSFLVFK